MNKRLKYAIFASLFAVAAYAAKEPTVDLVSSVFPQWFQSGIYVGAPATNPVQSTTNKVSAMLASEWTSYDFPSMAFANETAMSPTCEETFTVTVTGALPGDDCSMVGNFGMDGGAALSQWAILSCRAITNGVVGRACIAPQTDGGTLNLADAGYKYFLRR